MPSRLKFLPTVFRVFHHEVVLPGRGHRPRPKARQPFDLSRDNDGARAFALERGNPAIIPLTEYLEYFQNWKGRKSMKRKAGDGDRTRGVQLGICPSFVYQRLPCSMRSQRAKEFSRNCKNDTISSLNGVNGVWNCCRRHPLYKSREPSRFSETGPRIRHGRKTTQAYEAAGDSASAKPRSASGDPYSSLGTGSTTSRDFLTKILVS